MKKTLLLFSLISCALVVTMSQSCKKEKDSQQEFVADDNTFKGFMSWPQQGTFNGPDPLLGAMAHANNDSTVVRAVHFKNGQDKVNGKYPVGTVIVKHSKNSSGTVNEFTGMVKRGNNFDAAHNDWEYFMLAADGAIMKDSMGMTMRGATLMGGMCQGCHGGASAKDYVFSK